MCNLYLYDCVKEEESEVEVRSETRLSKYINYNDVLCCM